MKKHNIILPLILIIVCGCFYKIRFSSECIVTIKNNTDESISGLTMKFSDSGENDIEIPEIAKKKSYKFKLNFPEDFGEGFIKIDYMNNQNEMHEEYIEGYIEKCYKNNLTINISSIDDNGILTFNIYK